MHPLHDNDLDRLSREAADNFEVEAGAAGWEHLEMRLDQELPQKKHRRRFLFWLFLITVTTGGGLIAIIKTNQPATGLAKNDVNVSSFEQKESATAINSIKSENNSNNNNSINYNSTPANSTTLPAATQSANSRQKPAPISSTTGNHVPAVSDGSSPLQQQAIKKAIVPNNNIKQPVDYAKTNKLSGHNKPKRTSPDAVADKQPLSLNDAIIKPNNRINNTINQQKQPKYKQHNRQRTTADKNDSPVKRNNNVLVEPGKQIVANDRVTTGEPVNNGNDQLANKPADQNNTTPVTETKTAVVPADSAAAPVTETAKKDSTGKKKNKITQPLELGLVAGPDASTVKFGPLYKAGYIFGLQVGYRFTNRWSVNTGLIHTKKYYQADSQDYHPKYTSPMPNKDLDYVTGNCSMWEIPLNVRYDVSYHAKRSWFISTGLSTYLMDKENYDVYYTWNGISYPYPVKSDSNKQYLFSILNLSAGYERSLGKHFSIQAEPYLKIPLKGLGYGNMRMNSYGIFFSLKYKPTLRSKQSASNK